MKIIKPINFLLAVLAILLIITLFIPPSPVKQTVEQNLLTIIYRLDTSEPECYFYNPSGHGSKIPDINRCCYELQKQLICERIEKNRVMDDLSIECYTSKGSWKYAVNPKTFNYCIIEGYNVEKIE